MLQYSYIMQCNAEHAHITACVLKPTLCGFIQLISHTFRMLQVPQLSLWHFIHVGRGRQTENLAPPF